MTVHDPGGSGTPRQRDLIRVATDLFAHRGYHSVGINDISRALGLTGPAFYRHFPSKQDLLIAVMDDAVEKRTRAARERTSTAGSALDVLDALVADHLRADHEEAASFKTWRFDVRALPAAERQRLRYLDGIYTREWVRTLRELRPELDINEAHAVCHAAMAWLESAGESVGGGGVTHGAIVALLSRGARAILLGQDRGPIENS